MTAFKAFKAFSRTILKFGFGEARLRGTSAVSWLKLVPESHRGFPKWEAHGGPKSSKQLHPRQVPCHGAVASPCGGVGRGGARRHDATRSRYGGVSQFLMAFLLVT